MQFRRALRSDLDALVDLQNKNSVVVDPSLDRTDGSLASAFSAEDFAAINNDLAVVVCVDDNKKLLGFVCGTTTEFNKRLSLPTAMMARFDNAMHEGRPLSDLQCVITGPVCVEKASRGLGIFENLYGTLWNQLPTDYEVAVALVSTSNPRSLAAHKKIGMIVVDQFVFNDRTFDTIARGLGSARNLD